MKTLFLEKRGCNFFKDSIEGKQCKDFDNFRYCGWISKPKQQFVEMTIHARKKSKYSKFYVTKAYLSFSYENRKGCFADLGKSGFCEPTEKQVIEYINKAYNRKFKKIQIVDCMDKI